MIRYQLSMTLVPIPNIFTYNINLITGNQPIMATIFRILFIAQCVKHRSSNQTLTGSNLAEYSFFFYHNKFLFFLHSFLFFLFYGVYLAVR